MNVKRNKIQRILQMLSFLPLDLLRGSFEIINTEGFGILEKIGVNCINFPSTIEVSISSSRSSGIIMEEKGFSGNDVSSSV